MAPLPQDHNLGSLPDQASADAVSDEDIVISGVSGLLPNCDSFQEFSERLYKKENMVKPSERGWNLRHPELPSHAGVIRGVDKFDAQFFAVNYSLTQAQEPMARKLFEHSYQAIFDAGICPNELSGKRVGVYATSTQCDSEKLCSVNKHIPMGIMGCSRTMFANRISFYLNLKGPSMAMDGDSAGSILALENAYVDIKRGYCDAAIVAAGKLVLHPQTHITYNRTEPLNTDGKTKCYDSDADGQSLSEAVTVMYLQKYKDAKRVYGILKYAMTEFGISEERTCTGILKFPRTVDQVGNFFQKFYDRAGISPSSVEYVEGFGAASPELDKLELQVVEKVFCENRQEPLLVGSVASNIGFTDAASSNCGIFKILLGFQRGQIAANLHCNNPRQDVAAIRDGRMRIVTDHTNFNGSYVGVNAFAMTGVNGHALLQRYQKPKDLSKYQSAIPYLVTASGRQESAVEKILEDIHSRPLDPEEIALIHNVFKFKENKHLARGFGIYSTKNDNTTIHCQKVDYYDGAKQPLWFVYSGMGSQWVGMGKHLMRIPLFAETIMRCHKVLETKGLDLINIITTDDKSIFDNILHAFVGISAIQIALTDVLKGIGVVPDNFIGHSLGEQICAYADGCCTLEEIMLLSYTRGTVSISIPVERGTMAAVGIGYKQLSKICPPEIDIACHNSSESSTISGPYDIVQKFIDQLTAQGIFAKKVQSSNIAYHSRYIAEFGPVFLKMVKDVIKTPKLRSDRWISTSVPSERWNEPDAMYSSPEYHKNNLLSPVLFEEMLRFIPPNAIVMEIAPHSLLNTILRRVLPNCCLVPLTRRSHPDGVVFCLEAIGNLYMQGYDPDISALYPKIDFPVSVPTRPLSHLVEWNHTETWKLCGYLNPIRTYSSIYKQILSVHDDEYKYFKGHHIEGTRVVPFAACLVAAWDTLAMTLGQEKNTISVHFEDVHFHSQPPLRDNELVYLVASVQRGSGHFEVNVGNTILVEGTITAKSPQSKPSYQAYDKNDSLSVCKEDIYRLLYDKGYYYRGQFRSIYSMDASMMSGLIEWQDNWVTFLDALLQTYALHSKHTWVSPLRMAKSIVIDVKANVKERINEKGLLSTSYDEIYCRTRCGGVTIEHLSLKSKFPSQKQSATLYTLKFVPFNQTKDSDIVTALNTIMQIVSENVMHNRITLYFIDIPKKQNCVNNIKAILKRTPEVEVNIISIRKEDILENNAMTAKPDAVFMHDLLSDKKIFEALYKVLPSNTFIISVGVDLKDDYPSSIYSKVSSIGSGRNKIELANFKPTPAPPNTTAITVRSTSDMHQLRSTCELLRTQQKLLVLAPHPVPSGLTDQVQFWRRNCNKDVSVVMFDQKDSMRKELERIPNMALSVLYEGSWGGNYYVPTRYEPVSSNGVISLTCTRPGDLDSLKWVGIDSPTNPGIDVTVHYAGLVGYDATRAQGAALNQSAEERFGMDFSGVTASGERVMGLIARGSASNKVKAHPNLLWPVPAHWTMEDAATVPYAYCYAIYVLNKKFYSPPLPGQSILISGGCGALGQALISLSLAYGLEVYVSVSDVRKKRFLKKLFPELKDDHIGNSRDCTSKDMVKRGKDITLGCDIVVNCVKAESKTAVINSCAMFGTVIDTTQLTIGEKFNIGMYALDRKSYVASDFSSIFNEDNGVELRKLQLMLAEGIVRGYVKPLARVTYGMSDASRAFRLLAASRHRGRVLLSIQDTPLSLLPRISCTSSSSYVVIFEDQNFGVQFTDLLVRRGAKKLYLHAEHTHYLKYNICLWEKFGVQVEVSSDNLTKKGEAMYLVERSQTLGDIDGIYVLANNFKQKPETTAVVLSNLDLASRKGCTGLRHFAIISEDDRDWRGIINMRSQNGLPSLSLLLPKLEQFDTTGSISDATKATGIHFQTALKAVEAALFSNDHVVLAQLDPAVPTSILKEVANIPGVNITNATVDRTSLEQVGVDHGRALELCNILKERFFITMTPELVPKMTIGQLKKLEKVPLNVDRDLDGFSAYINALDKDEMLATNEICLMTTLIHRNQMRADEFDLDQNCLCIIPGVEGHHDRFKSLCERLKVPAVVLQPGHNNLNDSLQEAAQRIANSIMKYLKPQQTFYLLGYELGVMLSLEVAAILESYGMVGTVYMLGGTPEDIQSSFADRWKDADENSIQDALIQHIYTTNTPTPSTQLAEDLHKTRQWTVKVEALVNALRPRVSLSSQYIRGVTEGIYSRVKLLQDYNSQHQQLKSKIILIQAKPFEATGQNLKHYTSQEPVVINLNATLPFAHKDLNVPNIINKYLEESILKAYDVSNQCDTVLMNKESVVLM